MAKAKYAPSGLPDSRCHEVQIIVQTSLQPRFEMISLATTRPRLAKMCCDFVNSHNKAASYSKELEALASEFTSTCQVTFPHGDKKYRGIGRVVEDEFEAKPDYAEVLCRYPSDYYDYDRGECKGPCHVYKQDSRIEPPPSLLAALPSQPKASTSASAMLSVFKVGTIAILMMLSFI
ncbi:unnamed protein product [Mesocestoides corti]|uniref:Uncharacterized protein n=1 Tax=Mesocestoides corti TaxID=53468 RepID=A0A0R3UIR6_MESCO|nr:unnamed protein product [Mesocestoides corti]